MPVTMTHRGSSILLLAALFIALGLAVKPVLLEVGIVLILVLAGFRSYVSLSAQVIGKVRVEWRVKGIRDGEEVEVSAVIQNPTVVPILHAEMSIFYSSFLKLERGSRAAVVIIPPRSTVEYRLWFRGRTGRHRVGPISVVVRDPFGLFKNQVVSIGEPAEFSIMPAVHEAVVRRLLAYTRSTGLSKRREPGVGVEFYDTREYQPGDELRIIDWKRSAKRLRLVVKEFEKETYQSVLFILDASPWMQLGPYGNTPFEHMARVVSSVSMYLASRGDLFGAILYTGEQLITTGRLSRGMSGYKRVLKALSSVPYAEPSQAKQSRSQMIRAAARKVVEVLPRERNIIILFTTSGDEDYEKAVRDVVFKLLTLGNIVYVTIPITTFYESKDLPEWARIVYRVKAADTTRKELSFAKKLAKTGVSTIATTPSQLPQQIARAIEASRPA